MSTHKPAEQSVENLRTITAELRISVDRLSAVAEAMNNANVDTLDITNYDQLRRALDYVDNYSTAASKALRQFRERRGDYGKVPSVERRDKPNKKAKKKG